MEKPVPLDMDDGSQTDNRAALSDFARTLNCTLCFQERKGGEKERL